VSYYIAERFGRLSIQQLGAALGITGLTRIFFAYLDDPASPVRAMAATTLLSLVPLGLAFLAAFRLPMQARAAGADQRGARLRGDRASPRLVHR
jgi:hypothetical protein